MPKGGRIGRDSDGKWKIAILKEYPKGLCRAFARLFLSQCEESDSSAEISEWFSRAVSKLVASFDEDATMGPDCCRGAALIPEP